MPKRCNIMNIYSVTPYLELNRKEVMLIPVALPFATKAKTSSFRTLPFFPLPCIWVISIAFSFATLRTAGVASERMLASFCGGVDGVTGCDKSGVEVGGVVGTGSDEGG
jgi:hypothetical protein